MEDEYCTMNAETIREWLRQREIRGKTIASLEEVCSAFPHLSRQVVLNTLSRLKKEKILYSPYSAFYVTIPSQYVLRGEVPPYYYMDAFMSQQGKKYYFGLLSAGALWGAAHQRAQNDFVVTERPRLSLSDTAKRSVKWIYRKEIPGDYLCTKNGEAGPVVYSNAELTALDLVQYEQYAGGYSVVATLLGELLESTDFSRAADGLFRHFNIATIQRLGFIVEKVLGDRSQGEVIYSQWRGCSGQTHYVSLSPRRKPEGERDERWKIIVNTEMEVDEI